MFSAASLTAVAAPAAVIGLFLALSRRRLSRWSLESCKSECRGRQENWLIFICVFVVGCCCLSFYYPSQVSGRQKTTQHWQHCHLNLISPGLDLIMTPITQFQVLEWHRGMYANPPTVHQLVIFGGSWRKVDKYLVRGKFLEQIFYVRTNIFNKY